MFNMGKRKQSRTRYILFRVAAVAIGLSPLFLFEIALNLIGWNETNELNDPYIGFSEIRPLFVLNADGTQYEVSPTRYPFFRPERFGATKQDNEFRVFCLGGSTVQGRPYAIETSFTTWLEFSLQAADPKRKWQVINCGGVSYASYRLVPILKEVLNCDPDLIVLCTGHNEFLEDRTYESIKRSPAWINASHETLSRFKTYCFLRSFGVQNSAKHTRQLLATDVQPELDFTNGLDFYHWDDAWRNDVVKHFEDNLVRMVRLAENANVPIILMNPVNNLKHCAPFKSEHRAGLSDGVRARIAAVVDPAQENQFETPQDELDQIQALLKSDDQYAKLHFRAGHCLLALNRFDEAREAFVNAKERDVCPLRILQPMQEAIKKMASQYQVPLVDVSEFFRQRVADGIPGRETFVDHVHPTVHGHQLIAGLLFDQMRKLRLVEISNENWRAEQTAKFRTHLESLGTVYFQRGQDRLRSLRRWTKGKSKHGRHGKSRHGKQ